MFDLASPSSYVCIGKYRNSLFIAKKAHADRVSYICSEISNCMIYEIDKRLCKVTN